MKLRPSPALLSLLLLGMLLGGCETAPVSSKPVAKPAAKPVARPVAAAPAKPVASPVAKPVPPKPVVPPVATAPVPPAPIVPPPPPPPPPLAKEVTALVAHLTEPDQTDTLAHDITDTTEFPEAMASLAPGAQAPKIEPTAARSGMPPPRGLTADGDSVDLVERDWTGLVLVPINKALSKAYTSAVRLLKVEAHPLQDGRVRVWIRLQNIGQKQLPSEIACTFSMRGDDKPMSPNFYELQVPGREYRDVFFVSPAGELSTYTVLIRGH